MIHIQGDSVRFDQDFAVSFQRTLRVPDDGRPYPLPPGLGALPLFSVAAHAERLPAGWCERGGIFIPLYQREALWLGFRSRGLPRALKIAAGGFNVLSGARETGGLNASPQDYLVCPPQVWLDGVRTQGGGVRQFVAVPLGRGESLEAALGGTELRGGLQLLAFRPLPGAALAEPAPEAQPASGPSRARSPALGFGLGGVIQQKVYPDPYGIDVWDIESAQSLDVHALNSLEFRLATGFEPPPSPIDAKAYADRGLPWFELYDEGRGDLGVSETLRGATTLAEYDALRAGAVTGAPAGDESLAHRELPVRPIGIGRPRR